VNPGLEVQTTFFPTDLSVISMKLALYFAILLTTAFGPAAAAIAQSPQDARITISHPGFGSLKADLKTLIDLTLPAEQSQWENIEGYIDTFAIGIDDGRPVLVSAVTGIKPNALLIWVPLAATPPLFKEFRENLESLGYEIARDSKDHSLYQISQDPEFGWLRVVAETKYAVFVLTSDKATMPALKNLILKAQMPEGEIVGHMSAEILNTDGSQEAQKHRRDAFGEVRRVSMEAVQKRPEESATEFDLRKLAVKQQMDEGERLLAEAGRIAMILKLDKKTPAAPVASLSVSATAIMGSSLADAINQIGTQPDAFAGLAKFAGSALSGRLNHPVDPMRQANILEFLSLTEKDMADRLKSSKERTDAEKEMSNKVTMGVLDVVRSSINAGWLNGFIEAIPDGKGDFITVGAFSSPGSAGLTKVLPELANAGKGNQVQMDVDAQGDVAIHRVQLAEGYIDLVDRIFGVKKDLYIGIGPAHVWLASGTGSVEQMKKTIEGLGEPQKSENPVHLEISLLPWVQRFEEIAKTAAPGKTPEALELQREWARRRSRAIASFANGGDKLVLDFQVKDGEVKGELTLEAGILRFGGKLMSAFSKANFE
jgi:hypothetical protein